MRNGVVIAVEGAANAATRAALELVVEEIRKKRRFAAIIDSQTHRDSSLFTRLFTRLEREHEGTRSAKPLTVIKLLRQLDSAVAMRGMYHAVFIERWLGSFFAEEVSCGDFPEEAYEYQVGGRDKEIALTLYFDSAEMPAAFREAYRLNAAKKGWVTIDAEREVSRIALESLGVVLPHIPQETGVAIR